MKNKSKKIVEKLPVKSEKKTPIKPNKAEVKKPKDIPVKVKKVGVIEYKAYIVVPKVKKQVKVKEVVKTNDIALLIQDLNNYSYESLQGTDTRTKEDFMASMSDKYNVTLK